jgi:hypothetical protein
MYQLYLKFNLPTKEVHVYRMLIYSVYIVTILVLIGFALRLLHCAIYPTQHFLLNAGMSIYFVCQPYIKDRFSRAIHSAG